MSRSRMPARIKDALASLTEPEWVALEHKWGIEDANGEGSHSLTGCPPFTRAMCSYRRELVSAEGKLAAVNGE